MYTNNYMKRMKQILLSTIIFLTTSNLFAQLQGTEDMALIEVKVMDMNDKPRKKDIIVFEGINTKKIVQGITNDKGFFEVLIPEGDVYNIKIKGLGQTDDYSRIRIDKQDGIVSSGLEIKYDPGKVFTLNDVHFNSGQASLRSDSYNALNDLLEILKIKSHMTVEIAGHTDDVGDTNSNLTLSRKRAETVRSYLIKNGIEPSRLVAKGYGESKPIAYNDTPEGRQKNRRTEVVILSE